MTLYEHKTFMDTRFAFLFILRCILTLLSFFVDGLIKCNWESKATLVLILNEKKTYVYYLLKLIDACFLNILIQISNQD